MFLDECSINCGMARLYGRALRSERASDCVPYARFERTSVISSMRLSGKAVPVIFKGTLNGDLFKAYISGCLAPTAKKGDVLVLDNLAVHKVGGALDPIYRRGAPV
ncbi:MAG: transposase, partial [Fibromonadaceae bacterium]|nr:transposase [Fibromonadaceae bacterium]